MNKKDIKYIIKRILIGVGILFCVAFIKKCDVHAEELTDLHVNLSGLSCPTSDYDYSYFEDITSFTIDNYNITFKFQPGLYTSQNTLVMLFKNQDSYIAYTANSINPVFIDSVLTTLDISYIDFTSASANFYGSQNNLLYTSYTPLNFSQFFTYTTNSNNNFDFIVNDYDYYNYNCSDNIPNLYTSAYNTGNDYDILYPSTYDLLGYLINNYEFVYSNIPVLYDGYTMEYLSIPDYYTQINMKNYDSIYFVPKNYNTIPTTSVNNINFIDFDYYFQGNFKSGYFPLENTSVIVSSFDNEISLDNVFYVDSMFPLTENDDGTGYQYYSYIIYNNDKSVDSYIYYDSRYFDYYLVEDMSKYEFSINILDKDNNTKSIDINFDRNFQQIWEQGILDGSYSSINKENQGLSSYVSAFTSIIKRPFQFLKNVRDGTCSSFKAPIPFLNSEIEFPCMSSIYHNILGDFYDVFSLMINGVIIYYCIIKNLESFKHNIQPEYTKLDVVNL